MGCKGDETGRGPREMNARMSWPGSALSRKAFGEIFGSCWDIVMEEILGGLGFFPHFFAVSVTYMLIFPFFNSCLD